MKFIQFLSTILLFFSPNLFAQNSYKLLPASSKIELNIDARTDNYTICMQYLTGDNGGKFLYYFNDFNNDIICFDLNKSNVHHKIQLQKQGPNALGWVRGFYVLSKNRIVCSSAFHPDFYIINSKGEIVDKYDYSKTSDGGNLDAFLIHSSFNSPLIVRGNTFYGLQNVLDAWDPRKFNKIPATPISFSYNTVSKKAKTLKRNFPTNYWENGKFPLFYSRTFNGEKFIWSFSYDHNIYTYTLDGKEQSYLAKSSYIENFKPLSNRLNGAKYFVETPRYYSIIFDKYRNVYYRFAYPGVSTTKTDNINELFKYPTIFSIIVLDKNFKKIDELKVAANTYNMNEWFVAPEGLYISENHINNPNFDENKLIFRLFKLQKK